MFNRNLFLLLDIQVSGVQNKIERYGQTDYQKVASDI